MLTFKNSVLYYNYIYSGKIREIILDTSLNIAVLMRDYFYTNTSEDYRYRKELANFFDFLLSIAGGKFFFFWG